MLRVVKVYCVGCRASYCACASPIQSLAEFRSFLSLRPRRFQRSRLSLFLSDDPSGFAETADGFLQIFPRVNSSGRAKGNIQSSHALGADKDQDQHSWYGSILEIKISETLRELQVQEALAAERSG
jgi:hypothetical protein